MTLEEFNSLPSDTALEKLIECCHCRSWATLMESGRPFSDKATLLEKADEYWSNMEEPEFLEAFKGHARIGDLEKLKDKYSRASAEQGQVAQAAEATLQGLLNQNTAYEERHGFIFIVCASGKSASEMLALLEARIGNTREEELSNAANEQAKITKLRLNSLFSNLTKQSSKKR